MFFPFFKFFFETGGVGFFFFTFFCGVVLGLVAVSFATESVRGTVTKSARKNARVFSPKDRDSIEFFSVLGRENMK